MANKKMPWDHLITRDAVSSPDDLVIENRVENQLLCVQWLSVQDETTAFTSLRIIKRVGSSERPMSEQMTPQAGRLYWSETPIYLPAGHDLIVRFVGATAADKLRVYATGWKVAGVNISID